MSTSGITLYIQFGPFCTWLYILEMHSCWSIDSLFLTLGFLKQGTVTFLKLYIRVSPWTTLLWVCLVFLSTHPPPPLPAVHQLIQGIDFCPSGSLLVPWLLEQLPVLAHSRFWGYLLTEQVDRLRKAKKSTHLVSLWRKGITLAVYLQVSAWDDRRAEGTFPGKIWTGSILPPLSSVLLPRVVKGDLGT